MGGSRGRSTGGRGRGTSKATWPSPRKPAPPKKTGAVKPKALVKKKQATDVFNDNDEEETDSNTIMIK